VTSAVASVVVGVPSEAAWAALTDWAAQGSWMPLTAVAVTTGDGGLGTLLSARTGIGPAAVVDDMEIDVWEPPRRCEVVHRGRVIRGRGVFEVEAVDPSTARVTWTEQLDGRVAQVAAPASRWLLAVALRRFARICEEST